MPKKTSRTSITAATHRLTLEIARPHTVVWKAFTGEVHSWWPKDFYATGSPHRMVFEVKPGGRLYEDAGGGNGLVWYQVIALDAPNSISLAGFIAPPFGGPATSLLRIVFSAKGKSRLSWRWPIPRSVAWEIRKRPTKAGGCFSTVVSKPGSSGSRN